MKTYFMTTLNLIYSILVVPILTTGLILNGSSPARSQSPASIQYNAPPEPEVGDPSGRGRGGGSRDGCKAYKNLTALVPQTKVGDRETVWGMTTEAYPTFLFYVPVAMNAKTPMQFTLLDNDGNKVYSRSIAPLLTPAGIIHITIPKTSSGLQVKQSYRWGLSIDCDSLNRKETVSLRGMIHRTTVTTELQQQLESLKEPSDRAIFYAKQGIWFDALTTLARQSSPWETPDPKVVEAWSKLLSQGNLSDLETGAIVPCCVAPK